MNSHVSENLSRLLTGEATREEALTAAGHLRGCPDCQQELVSALLAHAALTSAHRFAPDVVAPDPAHDRTAATPDSERAAALPDLSGLFAKVREEATQQPADPTGSSRRRWLVAAAAAVVLAGAGTAAADLLRENASHPVGRTVTLQPVGNIRAAATAMISHGTMRIDATALPKLGSSRQYEVWLVAAGGQQLRPLGYVGDNRTANLPVAQQVMSRYDGIAISVQKTDQVKFSGRIVVAGHYA